MESEDAFVVNGGDKEADSPFDFAQGNERKKSNGKGNGKSKGEMA